MISAKESSRSFRHARIRKRITGSGERPRMCIHRSINNLTVQIIDDVSGKIILGKSTLAKDLKSKIKTGGNITAAGILGEALAVEAKKKGITKVSFDRGGYLYHGRVKAFAEAARKAGLEF